MIARYGDTDYGYTEAGYGYGVSAFTGFDGLSIVPDTLGWWSVARRVLSRYTGPAIRLRRSSDSAERDFYGIGPQGEVSTADVRAWNGWNLLAHSDNPDGWTNKVRVTFSNNSDTTWDGQTTADKIIASVDNDTHFISQVALVVGTTVTMTVEAKFAGVQFLSIGEGVLHTRSTYFDIQNGTVSTSNNAISASITSLGNGWYRCSRTWTVVGSTAAHVSMSSVNTSMTFIGNASDGVTVARMQLERASSFSTYEPRTTTAAGDSFLVTLYEQAENGRNLLARTEEFDDSYWGKNQTSVSSDSTTNPFGVSNADTVTVSAGVTLGQPFVGLWTNTATRLGTATGLSLSAGTYTYSIYAKPSSGLSHIQLRFGVVAGLTSGSEAIFRLSDGVLIERNVNSVSATSESVGDGWYRYTLTYTVTAGTWFVGVWFWNSTSITTAGTEGFHVWGAQLELGPTATAYEKRTDRGATRLNFTQSTTTLQPIICEQGVPVTESGRLAAKFVAADARRMSIASSTAMFNALHTTGGTVLCVSKANDTAAAKLILSSASSSTGAGFRMGTGSNEVIQYSTGRLDVAGVATAGNSIVLSGANSQASSLRINAAVLDPDNGTAASRVSYWENGTQGVSTNAQTGTPFVENAADNMTLGATSAGGSPHDGPISELALFSAAISTADRTAWQSRSGIFYTVAIS